MALKDKTTFFTRKPDAYRIAMAVVFVSGAFSLIVGVLLIASYVQVKTIDPLNNPELLQLRRQLAQSATTDDALVQNIRALDLLSRKAFFTSQAHLRVGRYLLLGGVIVFLIALRLASRWEPSLPQLGAPAEPDTYWATLLRAKKRIAFAAVLLAALALIAGFLSRNELPYSGSEQGAGGPAAAPDAGAPGAAVVTPFVAPTWDEVQLQWPSFRGPGGIGVAHFNTAPQQWDVTAGTNIRWKVRVPLPGFSSPVVWGNRVFLNGANADAREVYCFDRDTGAQIWKKTLDPYCGTPAKPPKVGEDTGFAAPTPVVHGDRVCAIFANSDLVCLDFGGKELWGRNLGSITNHYGHASSLIALDGLLYIQMDDNANPRLMALNLASGEEVWSVKRKSISWASPALTPSGAGIHLILNSEKNVDAYDPRSGAPVWSVECLSGEVAPSPAFARDTIFVANEYATATALRTDPSGVGIPKKAWEWSDILPEVASPVGSDKYFYIAASTGEVVCLDIESGQKVWTKRFEEGFYSSPVLVGDRVYAIDREGMVFIFKTGPTYEEVASIPFNEPTFATPAFLDRRIYARTAQHLYCIADDGNN